MLKRCTGPNAQLILAWIVLFVCIVGWPVSAVSWARGEPMFVLGLSWAALILGAFNTIITAYASRNVVEVKEKQEQDTT